jgi:hypothetical protein
MRFVVRVAIAAALVGCGPSEGDPDPATSTSVVSTGPSTAGSEADTATSAGDGADSTGGGADSTGGGGLSQTAACAAYLTCATAAAPAELGNLLEAYGPEGTCWQSTPEVAAQCDLACMAGLAQLQEEFCDDPACGGSCSAEPGPPVIVSVSWTNVPGCTQGVGSEVEVVIDVDDPDHDISQLTFSGQAIGCTGALDSATSTLFCPTLAPYSAQVEVSDPLGNQDALDFTFEPCVDGSAP